MKDLFWFYAAAHFAEQAKQGHVQYHDYWTNIEHKIKKIQHDEFTIDEIKEIVDNLPSDEQSKTKFTYVKEMRKSLLPQFYSKNWRKSYSPFLRNVIMDAIDYLQKRNPEAPRNQLFKQVFKHLLLFGIDLKKPRTVENIFNHHVRKHL